MDRKFIIILLFVCVLSCREEYKQNEMPSEIRGDVCYLDNKVIRDSLLNKAIETGDIYSYGEVSTYYALHNDIDALFHLAFIVANKYDIPDACFDVYYALTDPLKEDFSNTLDSTTATIAYFYFMRAYEMGFEPAISQKVEIERNCKCKLNSPIIIQEGGGNIR